MNRGAYSGAVLFLAGVAFSVAVPVRPSLRSTKVKTPATIVGKDIGLHSIQPVALRLEHSLLFCDVKLGDGRSFKALVDTGSGNLAVPSVACTSAGCRNVRGFSPNEDESGHFLAGASDLHLSFATGKMEGSAFEGNVCFGTVCGKAGFLVAAFESAEFAHFGFNAVLGLGPPRQALRPEFNVIGALAKQASLPQASFLLSLRSHGNSSLTLGSTGEFGASTHATSLPDWLAADARHGEWAVHMLDIAVDGKKYNACGKKGCRAVLDSGCAGIALPAGVLKKLGKRLRLQGCSKEAISEMPVLGFVLGNGHTYELRPEKYVEVATKRPDDDLSADADDDSGPHCRLRIQATKDFARTAILGLPFLLDRDIAFDQEHMRVGLVDSAKARPSALLQVGVGQTPPVVPIRVAEAAEAGRKKVAKAADQLRKDATFAVQSLEDMKEWRIDSARMLWALHGVEDSHKVKNAALAHTFGLKYDYDFVPGAGVPGPGPGPAPAPAASEPEPLLDPTVVFPGESMSSQR